MRELLSGRQGTCAGVRGHRHVPPVAQQKSRPRHEVRSCFGYGPLLGSSMSRMRRTRRRRKTRRVLIARGVQATFGGPRRGSSITPLALSPLASERRPPEWPRKRARRRGWSSSIGRTSRDLTRSARAARWPAPPSRAPAAPIYRTGRRSSARASRPRRHWQGVGPPGCPDDVPPSTTRRSGVADIVGGPPASVHRVGAGGDE